MSIEMEDRPVSLPKAANQLSKALIEGLVVDAYKALRDGLQPGADIPALLAAVVSAFSASVGQIPNLPEALRQDALGSGEALVISALEAAKKIRALPPVA